MFKNVPTVYGALWWTLLTLVAFTRAKMEFDRQYHLDRLVHYQDLFRDLLVFGGIYSLLLASYYNLQPAPSRVRAQILTSLPVISTSATTAEPKGIPGMLWSVP